MAGKRGIGNVQGRGSTNYARRPAVGWWRGHNQSDGRRRRRDVRVVRRRAAVVVGDGGDSRQRASSSMVRGDAERYTFRRTARGREWRGGGGTGVFRARGKISRRENRRRRRRRRHSDARATPATNEGPRLGFKGKSTTAAGVSIVVKPKYLSSPAAAANTRSITLTTHANRTRTAPPPPRPWRRFYYVIVFLDDRYQFTTPHARVPRLPPPPPRFRSISLPNPMLIIILLFIH